MNDRATRRPKILLERHSDTEVVATGSRYSQYLIYTAMENILEEDYFITRIPGHDPTRHANVAVEPALAWSEHALLHWLRTNALDHDLFIGNSPQIIRQLRTLGWQGKVAFWASGGLPAGAVGLRNSLPFLTESDAVWCTSEADVEICQRFIVTDSSPVAVNLSRGLQAPLRDLSAEGTALRRALGVQDDEVLVAYVGRICPEKNVGACLEVVQHLRQSGAGVKLLIAGKFEPATLACQGVWSRGASEDFARTVAELELDSAVHVLGEVPHDQLGRVYSASDILLNLTLYHSENFGNVQVEAMACGLPIVCTAWGGLKDVVREGGGGYLADTWLSSAGPRFDMPKVYASLEALCSDEKLRHRTAHEAKRRATEVFSYRAYRRRLLLAAEELIDRPSGNIGALRLTNFGEEFAQRFQVDDPISGDAVNVEPRFAGWDDPMYRHLLEPYASRHASRPTLRDHAFIAVKGQLRRDMFCTEEPMWPLWRKMDDTQCDAVTHLARFHTTPLRSFGAKLDAIWDLVQDGVIGISSPAKTLRAGRKVASG